MSFYQCEERKSGKVECWDCQRFMPESDKCLEDSMIAPIYRMLHPDRKPVHYVKQDPPRQLVLYAVEIKPKRKKKTQISSGISSSGEKK